MRLEQIKYLIEIDRYKSMNIASKHIYMTQQNLSSAMKQLENELQLVLLERTSKGVFLTEEGQYIAEVGREILQKVNAIELYAQTRAEASRSQKVVNGRIDIRISPYFARTHFPTLVSQFCEKYPCIDVDMYVESSLDILKKGEQGQSGLGLINISEQFLSQDYFDLKQVNQTVLSVDRLIVLANQKSQIGKLKSVSIHRLLGNRLLFYRTDCVHNDWLLETFLRFGQPKAVLKSNSVEYCIANLQDNTALVPMAGKAAEAFMKSADIVKIPIRPKVDIFNMLVYHKHKYLSDAERIFIDTMLQADL